MLVADATPEDVVVCEALPSPTYLRSAAEGSSVKVAKDLQTDFARENGKRVDADEMGELLREQGELGEAAHCEEPVEYEGASGMGGGRKVGPDGAHGTSFFNGECIQCL